MKHVRILMLSIALLTVGLTAQAQPDLKLKPYIGVGGALSSNYVSPGAEFGFYNDRVWFSVGATTSKVNEERSWTAQYKNYFRVHRAGKVLQNYLFYAVNVSLEEGHQLGFEPGVATVFNVGKFSPQVSISFPTTENTTGWRPLGMSFGVGLNYWIK